MVPLGSQVTEQLNKLGIAPELLQARLDRLAQAPLQALTNLSDAYAQASLATGVDKFGPDVTDARVGLAPAWHNPPPTEMMRARARFVHRTYHRDLAPRHASAGQLNALMGRQGRGAMMVRRLHRDPVMRQSFERATALQVVRDGRMDGAVTVSGMASGRSSNTPAALPGNNLYSLLGAMDTAIVEQAQKLGVYASSDPEVFFGEGRDLDLFGKGSQYGVPSPSTTGVFGFTASGQPAPATGDQSMGIDTRVMQLKRMMDKRSQMYDLVRTIFDKYNESARTSIGNMKA